MHLYIIVGDLSSPQFCDRSYGNITFVGAHDSYAVGVNNGESTCSVAMTRTLTLSSVCEPRLQRYVVVLRFFSSFNFISS